jgi:hypothetical protein
MSISTLYSIVEKLIYECGAFDGSRIGRKKWNTQRKSLPVSVYPPLIPHDLKWDKPQAAMVLGQLKVQTLYLQNKEVELFLC